MGSEHLSHDLSGLSWRASDSDTDGLQSFLLVLRGAFASGDDGTRMPHLLAFRRGEARDVRHDRLGHMFGSPFRGVLFGVSSDFTDHDDGLGRFVVFKGFQSLLQRRSNDGIATCAQACGESDIGQFPIS